MLYASNAFTDEDGRKVKIVMSLKQGFWEYQLLLEGRNAATFRIHRGEVTLKDLMEKIKRVSAVLKEHNVQKHIEEVMHDALMGSIFLRDNS